jgi:hypothetical protein
MNRGKNAEEIAPGLIWGGIPAFVWGNWGKPRKISMRTAGLLTETWTRELLNRKQDRNVRCMYLLPSDMPLELRKTTNKRQPLCPGGDFTQVHPEWLHELQMFWITCKMMITGYEALYLTQQDPCSDQLLLHHHRSNFTQFPVSSHLIHRLLSVETQQKWLGSYENKETIQII